MPQPTARQIQLAKVVVFLLALLPLAWLINDGLEGRLGPNHVESITHRTGDWILNFLMMTLAITPVRRMSGWHWLIRFRRMVGLFAFFYACLHFTTYIWLDQFFTMSEVVKDIAKRPYITVGFAGFVMLIPLAITSNSAMIRKLGARRWQKLHRLVYFIAIFGVLHYLWLVKSDISTPLVYGAILAVLLAMRLPAVTHKLAQLHRA